MFFLTQKLLPLINDGGRIINVSTVRTRTASVGGAAYASMKGAVEVLSRHMAVELGPRRITVNVVAPGPVATDFNAAWCATTRSSTSGSPTTRHWAGSAVPKTSGR